jgi:hypothetical protein
MLRGIHPNVQRDRLICPLKSLTFPMPDREETAKVFAMSEEEYYEYWNPEAFAH